jgi:CBS-domain-containing membrane protein
MNSPIRRVYRRSFVRLSAAFFYTRTHLEQAVNWDRPSAHQKSDEVRRFVTEHIDNLQEKFDIQARGLQELLKKSGTQYAYHGNEQDLVQATIVDPWAKRVVRVFQSAEAVARLIDALWLDALMNDHQRTASINEIVNLLRRFRGLIEHTHESTRAYLHQRDMSAETAREAQAELAEAQEAVGDIAPGGPDDLAEDDDDAAGAASQAPTAKAA